MRARLAAWGAFALTAGLAARARAGRLVTDSRQSSEDKTVSVNIPPGWESHPNELVHMTANPGDVWISNLETKQTLRVYRSERTWRQLQRAYGKPDAETLDVGNGVEALLRIKEPDAIGAFHCARGRRRYEFSTYGVNYPLLRAMLKTIRCKPATKPAKTVKPGANLREVAPGP